jgi:hypothetical protein
LALVELRLEGLSREGELPFLEEVRIGIMVREDSIAFMRSNFEKKPREVKEYLSTSNLIITRIEPRQADSLKSI